MARALNDREQISAGASLEEIHATLDRTHSSLYMAGTASILLLWGILTSVFFFLQFAMNELAPEFVAAYPWYPGPIWGVLGTAGMVGSSLIGHRASKQFASGRAARDAGIKVFLYWIAVVTASILIPGASGLWSPAQAENIPYVVLGVISLGYVLFGIMHRPAIAVVGIGLAAAFYVPSYLAGEYASLVIGAAMLAVCLLGAAWIRRSGLL